MAVTLAAVMNLLGAFLSVTVAATIASGIVDQTTITVPIIFAGLVGAIVWNVITWYLGIPSSSSHALVGGVVGSVLAAEGSAGVIWSGIASKVLIPALLAPFVCGFAAYLATRLAYRWTRSLGEQSSAHGFRSSQILSSSLVALAHGTNDAQKTMGVIVLTLVAGGRLSADSGVPMWVKVSCAVAVALGTFSGGWRVIRTLGTRVTGHRCATGLLRRDGKCDHDPVIVVLRVLALHHAGRLRRGSGSRASGRAGGFVHWSVVRRMVFAWMVTMPAAALIGAAGEAFVETAALQMARGARGSGPLLVYGRNAWRRGDGVKRNPPAGQHDAQVDDSPPPIQLVGW